MSNNEIICVLNVYKRPQVFHEQLLAVINQTITPKKIIVWCNNDAVDLSKYKSYSNILIITSSQNLGVWARFFSLYYLFKCKYICVFDDDTIPGKKWFENCLNTMNKHNALLGTIGLVYKQGSKYELFTKCGWDSSVINNPKEEYVDIVGHSWFFKKEWITTIIKDLPNIDEKMFVCGEDMHLSYVMQKYLNIPTMVPPHPPDDEELWGGNKNKSKIYGNINSTWAQFSQTGCFQDALTHYINNGFETILNKAASIKLWNNCCNYFINKIKNKENFSLLRFADGEYQVLLNNNLTNIDKWTFSKNSILFKHLNDALTLNNTNVYYGISGPSDNKDMCNFYYKNINNDNNITYANVFVNENYKRWINFLETYEEDCFLIACNKPANSKIGKMNIIGNLLIDEFLVNKWDSEYIKYFNKLDKLANQYINTIFLISAGPLSEVFIHKLYLVNPQNIYIDVGSSIDKYVKNKVTRDYQTNTYDTTKYIEPMPINIKKG